MNSPQKLLAVNLNYLGDALFTTPALAGLRACLPGTRIDVLAGARAAAILSGSPDVDRLLLRPPRGGSGRNLSLLRILREERYDAVVLFQSIFSNALMARIADVPVRVGFAQDGCRPFLSHPVAPRRPGEHVVAAYSRLTSLWGGGVSDLRLRITVSADDRAFAGGFLHDHELSTPRVGMAIGATRPQKRWPEEHFALLADRLWHTFGVSSLLLGGPEEAGAAARIAARARSPLVSAVGRTSPKQLAALIARCDGVISGDSGPLHIATALETPVVALFGSTDPAETGPWHGGGGPLRGAVLYDALTCAPCRKSPTCDERFDCLRGLTPDRVLDALVPLLGITTRRALPMASSGEVSR